MYIPAGPCQYKPGAALLQQGGSLQRRLEIVPDGNHAHVKISYPKGGNKLLIGGVADLHVGHIPHGVIDPVLININGQHLVFLFHQGFGHMPAETPQTNN